MKRTPARKTAKATQGNVERLTYTVPELCRALGRNRVGIYADLASGIIPSRRLGNRYIISRAAIDKWLSGSDVVAA